MSIDARAQAVLFRFLLFFIVGELPIVTAWLGNPTLDLRLLAIGLLTGLAGALEKFFSPQLVTMTGGVTTLKEASPSIVADPTSVVAPH